MVIIHAGPHSSPRRVGGILILRHPARLLAAAPAKKAKTAVGIAAAAAKAASFLANLE